MSQGNGKKYWAIHKGCGGYLASGGGVSVLGVGQSVTIDFTPVCEKCGVKISSQQEIEEGEEVSE